MTAANRRSQTITNFHSSLRSSQHNLGQIASIGFNNLGYFSKAKHKIVEPLSQPPDPDADIVFDPNKTYLSIVIGDGDNLLFMKNRNYLWVQVRQSEERRTAGAKR